jgi:hypothetical protein
MNPEILPERITILGITKQGEKFRPSDWAERLQDCISTHQDCSTTHGGKDLNRLRNCMASCSSHRKAYLSPHIHINFREETKSMVIDRKFWESKPMDYEFLMNFAKANDLHMVRE